MTAKNITKLKHRFPLRQLRQIPKIFRLHWPVFFLLIITIGLSFLNYEPGTFLLGWDNLNPEFDTTMNLKRALFSVWQEHRGLGLLAGQAHAADLPRILLILFFETINIPQSLIRYLTTFLPLVIGPLGVYYLFYHHLFREKLDAKTTQFASFLGALFYLLNLNTLQTFFVPFETFTWFYGAFPWLLFFLISYLSRPSILRLSTLFIVSFISAPAFYVETIYLVFLVAIFPFIVEFFTQKRSFANSIKTFSLTLSSLILPHLFWLLPVAFFVFTAGHVAENAHINVISSPETYYRNLEFATLPDIALLKGYLFNYLDMGANFKYDFLLSVWRGHLDTPFIALIGYLSFGVILIGLYYSLKKKFDWTASFMSVLGVCLFFLMGGGLLLNQAIPLFGELFRSPFTKFSIPLSLAYSFFFAIGSMFVLDLFTFLHSRLTYYLTLFTVSVLLLLFMSPAFSGNLISSNMRLTIPQEYFDMFDFFRSENPATRIANLPQYTFWGWNYYDWGYRGSGFLWHGLKQPLLDRAFDVWDKSSERYYEEISSAVFSGNQEEFEKLIDKYAVTWLLLDKHVISPDGKTDLGTANLEKFLESDKFTLERNFNDQIYVYKSDLGKTVQNFLSTTPSLPSFHPFENLTHRPSQDWTEKGGFLSVASDLATSSAKIQVPSLSETESLIPIRVQYQKLNGTVALRLSPLTPVIFAGDKQIDIPAKATDLTMSVPAEDSFVLQIDDHYFLLQLPAEVIATSDYTTLATTYVPSQKPFNVSLYSIDQASFRSLTNELSQAEPTQCYTDKKDRKIEKILSPDGISLLGTDVNACLSTAIPVTSSGTLLSYSFIYSSPSLTTGNVNITGKDFAARDVALPLEPTATPQKTTLFTHSTGVYQQLNLILEADGTKSIQEIAFRDVTISTHPQLYSVNVSLPDIDSEEVVLDSPINRLQVSLPLTASEYDILQTPQANSLFPENRNCDQFSKGDTVKIVQDEGFFYQSRDAVECDYLNLRHLPHSLSYLITYVARNEKGLPLTTCLENYSTHRCDIFERLDDNLSVQSVINPVTNSNEPPGYTLHLFNQSIGNRISTNLLRSLSIRPIPLNFIKNISVEDSQNRFYPGNIISSNHPNEFQYTLNIKSAGTSEIHLFQTKSPYWKAVQILSEDFQKPPLFQSLKYLFLYPNLFKFAAVDNENWYNTWAVPSGENYILIIYLPQYLEFLGFAVIIASIFTLILFSFLNATKKPLFKERPRG